MKGGGLWKISTANRRNTKKARGLQLGDREKKKKNEKKNEKKRKKQTTKNINNVKFDTSETHIANFLQYAFFAKTGNQNKQVALLLLLLLVLLVLLVLGLGRTQAWQASSLIDQSERERV